jgi:hypothetical protein
MMKAETPKGRIFYAEKGITYAGVAFVRRNTLYEPFARPRGGGDL